MRPETALAAVAAHLNTAGVLPGGCHYPAQSQPTPRSGQVEWQGFRRGDQMNTQIWFLSVALYVIGPRLNESTYDTASVDPLVTEVADVFDPNNPVAYHLETGGDRVDFCRVPEDGHAVRLFAGFYAFLVTLEIKLTRFAGSA